MTYSSTLTRCPCCGAIWQPTLPDCAYCTFMPTEPDSLSGEDTSLLLWFGRVLDHRLIMRTISMSSLIWKRIAFGFLLTACIFLGTGYATGLNMRSVSALFLLLTLPFQIALLTSLAKWIGLRHVDAAYHEIGSAITDDFLRGRNQSKRNLYAVLAGAEREQIFFLQGFLPAQLTKTEDKKERAQQVFEAIFRRLGRNSFLHTEPRKLAFVMGLHTLITAAGYPFLMINAGMSWLSALACLLPVCIWCCAEVSGKWYLSKKLISLRPSLKYMRESVFRPLGEYAKASGQTIDELLGSDARLATYQGWWKKYGKVKYSPLRAILP